MNLYVNTPVGLEITWNPEDEDSWGQHLDYTDYFEGETVLRPATFSDEKQTFYAVNFGLDGRIKDISYALSDAQNANRSDGYGYYLNMTCYVRTDEKVPVSLSRSIEGAGTFLIGTPIWDEENIIHNDGGQGAQSAIRVGFRITKYDLVGRQVGTPEFIVYEPNCKSHLNHEIAGIYQFTPSIDGTENLVPDDRLIRQNNTFWKEMDPVQRELLHYVYGEFLDDTHLFDLEKNCMAKIEIYLWLEGQDVDCTNEIGKDAQIFANLQFHAVNESGSGMQEIVPDYNDNDD
jgi:hypothetical protein